MTNQPIAYAGDEDGNFLNRSIWAAQDREAQSRELSEARAAAARQAPALYNVHMKSLLTFRTRQATSRVTREVGQRIVDRMNREYEGRVAYWLEPAAPADHAPAESLA